MCITGWKQWLLIAVLIVIIIFIVTLLFVIWVVHTRSWCTFCCRNLYIKRWVSRLTTSHHQYHLGRACRYPHIEECTLPLLVLAVACTMYNEALRKHYGSVTGCYEIIQKRCTSLRNVMEHYRSLQDVTEHYGSVMGCCGALRNITERCGTLWNITEALWIVTECYGALTERNRTFTENIDFAHQSFNFEFCWSLECRHTCSMLRSAVRFPPPQEKEICHLHNWRY